MKYNININQKALIELSSDMDVFDASILEYIKSMCSSSSEKIEDKRIKDEHNNIWTWIDLGGVMKDMPLLQIKSKGAITRRIQKIEKNGFIRTYKKSINGHIRLFIKIEAKTSELDIPTYVDVNQRDSGGTLIKKNAHVDRKECETEKHVDETAPIIYTSNTIHNNTSTLSETPPEIPESPLAISFKKVWQIYPLKKGKMVSEQSWRKLNPSPELEQEIIQDIQNRTSSDRQWLEGFIPFFSTYLNQQRWTDEITKPRTMAPKLDSSIPHTKGKYSNDKSIII